MAVSAGDRVQARGDLAWAIAVGGIGVVAFAVLILFSWYYAATLFLILSGMLLGVALNAMTVTLGRVVALAHALRLAIVCLALAGMLAGVVFLGGSTIAQQATVLSKTIKSQIVNVEALLENPGSTPAISALAMPPATRRTRPLRRPARRHTIFRARA